MKEKHLILKSKTTEGLLESMAAALSDAAGYVPVFRRFFLTTAEQAQALPPCDGAVSFIVQPPLDGNSIAVWIWLVSGAEVETFPAWTLAREGGREHFWHAGLVSAAGDSAEQTSTILEQYQRTLGEAGMRFADNCVRTWFFVHDIDHNYAGLVKARRENFEGEGLLPSTHYIASTGIAGTSPRSGALVQMDAYAVRGEFSQKYLYAPTHLNPTYEYGVTFERGVKLQFGGESRTIISGTASIDNKGAVLHIGDSYAQTLRMLENVETLLAEAGASWNGVQQAIVYLRNASDYEKIAPLLAARLKSIPYVVTLAPVCRPDWLVEMECIAF